MQPVENVDVSLRHADGQLKPRSFDVVVAIGDRVEGEGEEPAAALQVTAAPPGWQGRREA
jgi:hypothetical protein